MFGCADVTAVADMGLMGRTIFIVCSDHGDMDMEQQQFCERQTSPPSFCSLWTASLLDKKVSPPTFRFCAKHRLPSFHSLCTSAAELFRR